MLILVLTRSVYISSRHYTRTDIAPAASLALAASLLSLPIAVYTAIPVVIPDGGFNE